VSADWQVWQDLHDDAAARIEREQAYRRAGRGRMCDDKLARLVALRNNAAAKLAAARAQGAPAPSQPPA
jgi:hypothetical protein